MTKAQDLGSWEIVLNALSILGVISSAFVVAFTSRHFNSVYLAQYEGDENSKLTARLAFILIYEHLVFGLKALVAFLIPDVPGKVALAIEKEAYLKRLKLNGGIEDEDEELDIDSLKLN